MNPQLSSHPPPRWGHLDQRRSVRTGEGRQVCALTERRRVDRRHQVADLQHREVRLRTVTQATGVGVYDLDYATGSNYLSPELKAIVGLSEEADEIPLERIVEVMHPEDRERFIGKMKASLDPRGDGSFEDEHRLVQPDGTIRWVRARGQTFFADEPGRRPLGATGIVIDISDRRADEDVRREQEELLRLALKAGQSGTFDWDARSNGIRWSEELLALYGLRREEFGGRYEDWLDCVVPEDRDGCAAAVQDALLTGEFKLDFRIRRRDNGEVRWMSARAEILFDGAGKPDRMVGIHVDITERKLVEARIQGLNAELEQRVLERTTELRRANDALLRSNMELRHFAHAAAHDLQTPLRSIAGFAQLLRQEVEGRGGAQVDEWSSLVIDNARRLQTLIQELLAYTRLDIQGLPFQPVNLRQLFNEVKISLAKLIDETGAVVSCESLPTASVDRVQIAQVLLNLIENGIKYNKSKPPQVTIGCERQIDQWVCSVADNGIGIDPRHHERIFEIFRRLHSYGQVPGTGIGLALCRRILERHGGRIWVESRPGEGSTFYFSLPIRKPVV